MILTLLILGLAITAFMWGIAASAASSSYQRDDVLATSEIRAEIATLQQAASSCKSGSTLPAPSSSLTVPLALSPAAPACPTPGTPTLITVSVTQSGRLPHQSVSVWVRAS